MTSKRRKGFDVAPNAALYTAVEKDGVWSAWVEDDRPSNPCGETIKVFEGGSAYQAQIKALRWMRERGSRLELAFPVSGADTQEKTP